MTPDRHLTFECAVLFDHGLNVFSLFLNLYAGKSNICSFTGSYPDMDSALTVAYEKWELYDHMYGNSLKRLDEQTFEETPGQLSMF